MADICLVEPKYKEYDFTYVPTGLLSLAAKLMEYGHNVDVYYCNNLPKRYNIIGISSTFVQYCNALDIARRAFADVTILGGAYVTTDAPAAMKSTLFDYGVIGDGEDALAWLVRGKNPERIPGVVYKRSGAIVINPNLDYDSRVKGDRWPIPAYSCFVGDVGGYINITKNREYVWNWGWQRRNRPKLYRDFQKEVSELLSLGVRGAYVTDENFGSNPGGLRLTVEALDRFESWRCRSTVDEIVNRRLDLKIKGSKCSSVEIDVTTASARMRDEYGLPPLDLVMTAISLLDGIGIDSRVHIVLGLPGETVQSIEDTWKWLQGKKARLSTYAPMPGDSVMQDFAAYNRFGFDVVATDVNEFILDKLELDSVPWRSSTIETKDFIDARNQMVREFL